MAAGARTKVAAVAVAALMAVVAGGCSSGSGGEDATTTTTQPTPAQVARRDRLAAEQAACEAEVASLQTAVEAFMATSEELRYPNSTRELLDAKLLSKAPAYHDITTGGQIVLNQAGKDIGC